MKINNAGDRMEQLYLQRDNITLSIALFDCEDPALCLQIIHGAKEHKERYYPFAQWLSEHQIAVVISDNRGHGESLNSDYPLGHMNGWKEMVADQYAITQLMKQRYPGVSVALLGHSFGSVLARCYLQEHDAEISSLILTGTANYVDAVPFGLKLGRIITAISGAKNHNKLLLKLGDGEDDSWVCSDPEVMRAYRADPLCHGYRYTNGAIMTIWQSDYQLKQYRNFRCQNPDLPILSLSGGDDPVTGGESGLADSIASLEKIGYSNIRSKVYPGMKHEVLNETQKAEVWADVLAFLH